MNCIFCQETTANSASVEHIIPESLGNKEFILDKGWVCDQCNHYIAIKIERPLLQLPFFLQNRHDLGIKSKKNRIPSQDGFLLENDHSKVTFHKNKDKEENIEIDEEVLEQLIANGIVEIPAITVTYKAPGNSILLAKFLGKIAIELLAYKAMREGYDQSIYNQESLDNIKRYIRRGDKNEFWPYTTRQIYDPEAGFEDENGYFKVTCTWEFILTQDKQLLFQFLFTGTEFTIDLLNQHTGVIKNWFQENDHRSITFENLVRNYGKSR